MAEEGQHVYSDVQHFTFDDTNLMNNTYEIIIPEESEQTFEIHTVSESDTTTVTANTSNIIYVNSNGDIFEADDIQMEYHDEDKTQEEPQYQEIVQPQSPVIEQLEVQDNLEESLEQPHSNEGTLEKTSVSDEVVQSIEAVVSQPLADDNQVPIKCVLCKDEFANFSIFRNHLFDFHISGKLFKCKQCDKQFDFGQELKKHVTSHTGVKYFNCEYCGKGFLKRNIYEGHLLIHTGETLPYHCVYCDHKFRLKETATLHIWRHEKEGGVHAICPDCDLSFYTELSMKHHTTGNRGSCNPYWKGKAYTCQVCSHISPMRLDYVAHFKSNHPDKYFLKIGDVNACVKCGTICDDEELVAKHVKLHKVKDIFHVNCKICGKMLRGKGAYTLHMKMHLKQQINPKPRNKSTTQTSNEVVTEDFTDDVTAGIIPETQIVKPKEKPPLKQKAQTNPKCYDIELKEFSCEHCPFKALMTKLGAENHTNAHSKDPPYECQRCHQSYFNRSEWICHNYQCFKSHYQGEIPCPACVTEVDTLRGLKTHMRMMHKEHLVYQMKMDKVNFLKCPICHKGFLTMMSLTFHKRRHKLIEKGEKKEFQCPYCPMKLSTNLTLLVHKRGHTGERPYTCRFCSKSFKDRTSLRSHSIIHTRNFRHFCQTCQKGFVTPYKMKMHNERTHLRGIKPPKPKTPRVKVVTTEEVVYVEGQFETPF